MAQKRMFDKAIIETDKFLNVSLSAKAIYFLLGMEADDEGFISPKRVLRLYGGEVGDLKNLIDTGLVIPFQSGVVVITDWNENNYLDKNRIKKTQYQDEKKLLALCGKKYTLLNGCLTDVQPGEDRGGEGRIEEDRREENKSRRFTPPTLQEISEYCIERSNTIDPETFMDFYISNGWVVGKSKMKDWKAAIRTWEKREHTGGAKKSKEQIIHDKIKKVLDNTIAGKYPGKQYYTDWRWKDTDLHSVMLTIEHMIEGDLDDHAFTKREIAAISDPELLITLNQLL